MTKHNYSRLRKKKRESESKAFISNENQGIFRMHISQFVFHTSRIPHKFIRGYIIKHYLVNDPLNVSLLSTP